MISSKQYSSDFAQGLQYFIDIGEISYAHEDILNPKNYSQINALPFNDRYDLIHEMIFRKPILGRDEATGDKYDEFVAFLLMTIPYEPLCESEDHDAQTIAAILNDHEWNINISEEKKIEICKSVKDIYLELYKNQNDIPIGMIWPKSKAPKEAIDYMSRLHAVFCPYTIDKLKQKLHCETDLDVSATTSIAFNKAVISKSHILDLISITLHEIRHYSQTRNRTAHVIQQDNDAVSHLVSQRAKNGYYGLMIERQANAFMGRVEDLVKGVKARNEAEIAADMLCRQQHGRLSQSLKNAILDYNKFITQPAQPMHNSRQKVTALV